MILTGNDHDQMTGISILIHCLLTLSHTTRNSERGGYCRQETDGDLKNGLPSVCFHFTHFDSILKVKLNILYVSHEVFSTSIRSHHRRPVQCRPYCRRLG